MKPLGTGVATLSILTIVLAAAQPAHAQPPPPPVLAVASGDVVGTKLTFAWNRVPTATWYHLMVQDTLGVRLDRWYTPADAQCAGAEPACSVLVNLDLYAGTVYWWVQSYSPAGYSAWSTRGEFNAAGFQSVGPDANMFLGPGSGLFLLSGERNTGIGAAALAMLGKASFNTALGADALRANSIGSSNTAVGDGALRTLTGGHRNTAIGRNALGNIPNGSDNIAIGAETGINLTSGSSNIYIGSAGVTTESNAIRIGTQFHTLAQMGGIWGQTSFNGVNVFVNSSGRLGTVTSSARFKEDVRDIGDATAALARLRPVEFRYRPSLDPDRITQYGLIAEEVAEVWPELVVYDADGRPETVRYHLLVPLLLNELQKQQRQIQRLNAVVEEMRGNASTASR